MSAGTLAQIMRGHVGVRLRNGWPHDLTPSNLRLLCTRCAAVELPA